MAKMTTEEEQAFEEWRRSKGYLSQRSTATAEREFRRSRGEALQRGQATRIAEEFLLGTPEREDGLEIFTDPKGATTTFRAGTSQMISKGRPVINDRLYSPFDRRQLEKLYQSRSLIATDDSLSDAEKQRGFDIVDAKIGNVPQLSPSRREPTAQQKFDASIVTSPGGMKGTIDKTGKFAPLESSKQAVEDAKEYRTAYSKNLETQRKLKEELLASTDAADQERGESMSFEFMRAEAKLQTDDVFGRLGQPDAPGTAQSLDGAIAPSLDDTWKTSLADMSRFFGRASVKQMLEDVLPDYIKTAGDKGLSPSIATVDFLNRWKQEASEAGFLRDDAVAPWNDRMEKFLQRGKLYASSQRASQAVTASAQAEQPFARVNGRTIPLPQGPTARVNGRNIPVGRVQVRDKQGRVGTIPASQLEQALREGFTQVR